MKKEKLTKRILTLISVNKLTGYSVDDLTEKLVPLINIKQIYISVNDIRRSVATLVAENKIEFMKDDALTLKSSVDKKQNASGTLIVISKVNGGYITDDATGEQYHIKYKDCEDCKSGDIVSFTFINGKPVIKEVIGKTNKTSSGLDIASSDKLTGYVFLNYGNTYTFFKKDKLGVYQKYTVMQNNTSQNMEGCVVEATVNPFDDSFVNVEKIIGRVADPVAETNAIAIDAGIELINSNEIEKEVKKIPTSIDANNYHLVDEQGNSLDNKFGEEMEVVDLREKYFVTVDPSDCRDMDDSVYTEIDENGNFVTYCAIAHVTEFVVPGTKMWEKALKQDFTLYTPHDSYPMLDKTLSHGILSLNPNEDRLTLCVKSVIDRETGKRIASQNKVFHALINSKKKLSYEQVQNFIDSNEFNIVKRNIQNVSGHFVPKSIVESITTSYDCSNAVWAKLKSRHMMSFDKKDEFKFELDKSGTKVLDIRPKKSLPSMKMIEALMINGNEVTGEYTRDNGLNSVYRCHNKPVETRLSKLNAFLKKLGVRPVEDATNENMQKLIDYCTGKPYEQIVKKMALMVQSKAKYTSLSMNDIKGHDYGKIRHTALNSKCYTHFTSGIRRMSDLIVQYTISEHLKGHCQPFSSQFVADASNIISAQEVKINNAESKIRDMYCAIYAEDHINEISKGKVSCINHTSVLINDIERGFTVEIALGEVEGAYRADDIAIYNRSGNVLYKLCDEISYKISGADRINGRVYGSNYLTKTFENRCKSENVIAEQFKPVSSNIVTPSWKQYHDKNEKNNHKNKGDISER